MSNSPQADNPDNGPRAGLPTAVIHKKILDAARDDPDASLAELSQFVSGASVELVERVLENYGDPAERLADGTAQRGPTAAEMDPDAERADAQASSETEPAEPQDAGQPDVAGADSSERTAQRETDSDAPSTSEPEGPPSATDLTEAQLETLAAVAEHPHATQRELAEVLDVSCATVNRRVSAVEGLSWADRQSFVESLFETGDGVRAGDAAAESNGEGPDPRHDVRERTEGAPATPFEDPELVRKVLHACLESDRVTDDEELEIIGALVSGASSTGCGNL